MSARKFSFFRLSLRLVQAPRASLQNCYICLGVFALVHILFPDRNQKERTLEKARNLAEFGIRHPHLCIEECLAHSEEQLRLAAVLLNFHGLTKLVGVIEIGCGDELRLCS